MSFDTAYFSIGRLDRLSYQDTPVHRLDPRAKVIATMLFILTVVSYPKYEVVELAPFFLFPLLLAALGDIPVLFLLKKVLIVSPFAIFIGIFNPLFDAASFAFLGMRFSAGWISFLSILAKFTLTVTAALLLISTTSFAGVCHALRRFGLSTIFVAQLLFLYRYLFVLMEETMRIVRARDMRSFGRRGTDMKTVVRIIGSLFLRTVERAERIYSAMLARGFQGDIPSIKQYAIRSADVLFLMTVTLALGVFRAVSVPQLLGRFVQRLVG